MVVRVVYGGGLENRWVNSPGGSNPSPSEEHGREGVLNRMFECSAVQDAHGALPGGDRPEI
jgi:hypothetical protein